MRDFRDAKAMAHTLRAALATKGLHITVSQSLELIAQAFGVADWNTLSATIRGEAAGPRNNAHSPQFPTTATMRRALAYAHQRKHRYATLEHLLLALIDDVDTSAVMKACKVDLGALREKLTYYILKSDEFSSVFLTSWPSGDGRQPTSLCKLVEFVELRPGVVFGIVAHDPVK